jgi:hypothetical protein
MEGERIDEVRLAVEVGYYADTTSRPLLTMVRSIGVLAVVLGLIGLVLLPVQVLYSINESRTGPSVGGWFIFHQGLSAFASVALAACLLVASGGCLRGKPRGRRWLLGWAWAAVAFAVNGMSVNGWYTVAATDSRTSAVAIFIALGYQLKAWLAGLAMPLVVIALFRQRAVCALFDSDSAS